MNRLNSETQAAKARRELLAAIENDDITWEYAGTQTRVKWFEGEQDYRRLSKVERAVLFQMEQDGEIKRRQGWRFGIGGYERVGTYDHG